jgi:hypothetical protein
MAKANAMWDENRQSFDVAEASLIRLVEAYKAGEHSTEGFERIVRNHIAVYPQLVTEADKLPPALYEIVKAQRDLLESWGRTVPEMAKSGAEMAAITEATTKEMATDWETLRSNQVESIKGAMRESIRSIQVGVVDMKDRIKTGKEGFLEEVRLMAWQAKHPWAEENYADWLEKRIRIGNRKAKEAQRAGQEGQAAQWRAHVAGLKEELMSLPQTAAAAAQQVIRALAAIRTSATNARMTIGDQYYDPLSGRLISSFTSTRAVGGPASGMTWVGESGPELVNLPRGSHVNTARTSQALARDAGGSGISEFTIHVESDGGRVQDIVLSVMGKVLGGASESAHIRYMNPVGA